MGGVPCTIGSMVSWAPKSLQGLVHAFFPRQKVCVKQSLASHHKQIRRIRPPPQHLHRDTSNATWAIALRESDSACFAWLTGHCAKHDHHHQWPRRGRQSFHIHSLKSLCAGVHQHLFPGHYIIRADYLHRLSMYQSKGVIHSTSLISVRVVGGGAETTIIGCSTSCVAGSPSFGYTFPSSADLGLRSP